jgi:signal transduction histidine kinase
MTLFPRTRGRLARVSLQRKLPAAFAGVALLVMVALGAILIPLVNNHYSRSETSYLRAAAEQAATGLSGVDWQAVAAEQAAGTAPPGGGTGSMIPAASTETGTAKMSAELIALSTQVRVRVFDLSGTLLVDSGLPNQIDVVGLTEGIESLGTGGGRGIGSGRMMGRGAHRLPSPLGEGLFGSQADENGSRSSLTMRAPLASSGGPVANLLLSDGPDYGGAVVRTTLIAWLIAGCAAVILAAFAGWFYSRRLSKPLLAMAGASNSMAKGDLAVRAKVDRADEIGVLADSFNAMAEKNQATVTALRRFVADAAHEIGTPLTALQSDIELARDGEDKDTRERFLERAMAQAERIGRLSAALLRLSLLDTGLPSQLRSLDLVPVVRTAAGAFASRAEQAGVELAIKLDVRELPVSGYEPGLRGALDNLLDNALKFTPSGGSVEVGATAADGHALVWVADTGIGIPAEDLGAVFSRFHRGRNAAAYPGSGLGLAIVRATMDLHGGKASVSSAGAGSRFELQLPLAGAGGVRHPPS